MANRLVTGKSAQATIYEGYFRKYSYQAIKIMRRSDCFDRLNQAIQSYETTREILDLVKHNPTYLDNTTLTLERLTLVNRGIHGVYFTHMFACFESVLRDYWRRQARRTKPQTEQLIRSVAARLRVPQDTQDRVQEIRDYRNSLVHDEHAALVPYTLHEARKHPNRYVARMPVEW